MVLTYQMVLNRLDELNYRERQVRKFYKPLPSAKRDKPWPRRHRFADTLEPGDVVKTMGKASTGDWDSDFIVENHDDAANHEGVVRRPSSVPAGVDGHRGDLSRSQSREGPSGALSDSVTGIRPIGPSRDGQRIVGYATKKERQLRKAVDTEINERREKLRDRLHKEVGMTRDGEQQNQTNNQQPAEDAVEPLFRPPGRVMQIARKPTVHKTGTAPSKELAVYETANMRWTGGPVFNIPTAADLANQSQEEITKVEEDALNEFSRRYSSNSARRSSQEASEAGLSSHNSSEYEDDSLEGDYTSWRYRRTIVGDHDNPNVRDFYFAQVKVTGEMNPSLANSDTFQLDQKYVVVVTAFTLEDQPSYTYPIALGIDNQGRILFPRMIGTQTHYSTVMSPADDLPWVTVPMQLLGHSLVVNVFLQLADGSEGDMVAEKVLSYNAPPEGVLPPASAPSGTSYGEHGFNVMYETRGPDRPETAPANSPSRKNPSQFFQDFKASPSRSSMGEAQNTSPTTKWNNWAAQKQGEPDYEGAEEQEETSFEVSPTTKKKQELAKIRSQMRASLQQTQTQVLQSMTQSKGDGLSSLAGAGDGLGAGENVPFRVTSANLTPI